MAVEFKLPDLGENIESGDVVSLLVKAGDHVDPQQPVMELETDKAVIEVPSSVGGTVKEIHVKEGDKASVGQLVLTIEPDEESEEVSGSDEPSSSEQEAEPEEASSRKDEEESEREPSPQSASHSKKSKQSSERSSAGQGSRAADIVSFASRSAVPDRQRTIPASPAIRRLARELGVEIEQVAGSGPRGRITRGDVEEWAEASRGGQPARASQVTSLPDFTRWGEVETRPFTSVRRVTAQRMSQSWLNIPHVTQHDESDITELEARRRRYGDRVEAAGGKLTVTAITIKLIASALKKFPDFNASIDVDAERVILKQYVHVGVAVDTPRGLLVPVIRDVDRKNVIEIAVELGDLAARARDGKLDLSELQGGTFTITNLGGIGGTAFTPIVNWPEVAILGMARAQVRPVFSKDSFVPRTILPLSLSYDHRLIDGASAARFLRWVSQGLEDPFLSILDG